MIKFKLQLIDRNKCKECLILDIESVGVSIVRHLRIGSCGGIGRRNGLKIRRSKIRTGSSPVTSTIIPEDAHNLISRSRAVGSLSGS